MKEKQKIEKYKERLIEIERKKDRMKQHYVSQWGVVTSISFCGIE